MHVNLVGKFGGTISMRFVATISATLLKLALASAILALGWVIFSPSSTAAWRGAQLAEPWIARIVAAFPVERGAWGVLVLALGIASLLAAIPKKAIARPRPRPAAVVSDDVAVLAAWDQPPSFGTPGLAKPNDPGATAQNDAMHHADSP